MARKPQLCIQFDDPVRARIKKAAVQRKLSEAYIVRELVDKALEKAKKKGGS